MDYNPTMTTITRRSIQSGAILPSLVFLFTQLTASVCAAPDFYNLLKELKTEHPSCDKPLDLAVDEDYFGSIANDLPGVADYNQLTSWLAEKNWGALDRGVEKFMRTVESSPLREATAFLSVYSKLLRVREIETSEYKEALRSFAEAKLLYPKSTLIAPIVAAIASRHLKEGLYEKSLALYRSAREEYPFHELLCVFQGGIAESSLHLGDQRGAESSYQQLLQKCKNPRLRTAAELRLAELKEKSAGADSLPVLEKLFSQSPKLVQKYYPSLLYSLGEKKFQKNNLPSAKFFFTEYLKTNHPFTCKAYAAKRLADIAMKSEGSAKDHKKVVGIYLGVKETYPATDPGRFSHIHALVLGMSEATAPEFSRRLKVIDEELDLIENKKIRELAYLEKALALLDSGEEAAVSSLLKVKENSQQDLTHGKLAEFIRQRVVQLLSDEVAAPSTKLTSEFAKFASSELDLYESVMNTWLVHHPEERRARALVRNRLIRLVDMSLDADLPELAFQLLERGKKLALLPSAGGKFGDVGFRQRLGEKLLTRLLDSPDKKKMASWILENKDRIADYIDPTSRLIWLSAAVETESEEAVIRTVKMIGQDRRPASIGTMAPRLKDYYWYNEGKALALLKRWGEAEGRLASIQTETFRPRANELRLQIALEQKQYAKAFELGLSLVDRKKDAERATLLDTLRHVIYDGKLWSKVDPLLKKLKTLELPDGKLTSFHYLAGKAFWETKRCNQSIIHYEVALLNGPLASESFEAKYQLGKCYLQMGKSAQATKIWTDLAQGQDPFWSKLARNELNLTKNP